MSDLYKKSCQERAKFGEDNDCAVIAISIFCDVSYQEALNALTTSGRKPRTGTLRIQQLHAIMSLTNRNIQRHDVEEKFWKKEKTQFELDIRAKYPEKYNTKNLTVKQIEMFPEAWAHIKNAMIFVKGHVFCLKDGVVHDWTKGKRKHIEAIWVFED